MQEFSGVIQLLKAPFEYAPAPFKGKYLVRHSQNQESDSVHLDWEVQVDWAGSTYACVGTLMGKNMTLAEIAGFAKDAVEYGAQYQQRVQQWPNAT